MSNKKLVQKSHDEVEWVILANLIIIGEMLHFNWNDLMISAKLSNMKIVVTAMPNNITNLGLDSEEI